VIVDSYGSPTIRNDIKVFDKQFGFPSYRLSRSNGRRYGAGR
jgi:subtilase family serine protease